MASVEVNKWINEALFDLKMFSGLTLRQKKIRSRQKQMAHSKTKSTKCDIFIADFSLLDALIEMLLLFSEGHRSVDSRFAN